MQPPANEVTLIALLYQTMISWAETSATGVNTGEPFISDAESFVGHNEYEIRKSEIF